MVALDLAYTIMIILKKKYQLWQSNGFSNYTYDEFDTIVECITATKWSTDWFITKKVELVLEEKEIREKK